MKDIGALNGKANGDTFATAINDAGDIVGSSMSNEPPYMPAAAHVQAKVDVLGHFLLLDTLS
jgi:hypothetical protein